MKQSKWTKNVQTTTTTTYLVSKFENVFDQSVPSVFRSIVCVCVCVCVFPLEQNNYVSEVSIETNKHQKAE